MKILVPTDFSKNASHAMRYAAGLAQAMRAELILFHVYPPPVIQSEVPYTFISEEIEQRRKMLKEKLLQISHEISDVYKITCRTIVMMGIAVEEIINEIISSRIDFIVMGTKGATGLKKVLFGSHTASVISKATCPVLSVPEDASLTLPKNVVFATNYHESDIRTLKMLTDFVKMVNAKLTILHISKDQQTSERELIHEFSEEVVRQTGFSQSYFYTLPAEDIQQGIDFFVDSTKSDLLVLSTRKRTLFERLFDSSLTRRMAYQARLPLLVFHATSAEEETNDFVMSAITGGVLNDF